MLWPRSAWLITLLLVLPALCSDAATPVAGGPTEAPYASHNRRGAGPEGPLATESLSSAPSPPLEREGARNSAWRMEKKRRHAKLKPSQALVSPCLSLCRTYSLGLIRDAPHSKDTVADALLFEAVEFPSLCG